MNLVQKLQAGAAKRIFALTDMHGQHKLFKEFIKWKGVGNKDLLINVGDLVDRGDGSFNLLTHFLLAENAYSVQGNHEIMMYDALFVNKHASTAMHWIGNGGAWSFEVDESLLLGAAKMAHKKFPVIIDLELKNGEFLAFAHAEFPFESREEVFDIDYNGTVDGVIKNKIIHKATWGRRQIQAAEQLTPIEGYKTVFHGHTVTQTVREDKEPEPIIKGNQVWFDTGAPFTDGRMTVLEIDPNTGEFERHALWFDQDGELCIV